MSIDTVQIGCLGQGGRLWATGFSSIDVSGTCLGEVHVPAVSSSQLIRIGDALGARSGSYTCGCHEAVGCSDSWTPVDEPISSSEDERSPGSSTLFDVGQIVVDGPSGLAGQIVINANNSGLTYATPANLWAGQVMVPLDTSPASTAILAPGSSGQDQSPCYKRPAADLGGGAVGLVPYCLQDDESSPPNDDPVTILETEFNQILTPRGVRLVFPGPVRAEHATLSPLILEMWISNNSSWMDISGAVDVTCLRPGDSGTQRYVDVIGDGYVPDYAPAGVYRIRPRLTGTTRRLLCDDVLGTAHVPVKDFVYTFRLGMDCDHDGVLDSAQIAANSSLDANHDGILDICQGTCFGRTADFNCDGDVGTDADIAAFFACLGGSCPAPPCTSSADFNGDGDVGTDADIESFFRVLAGASC